MMSDPRIRRWIAWIVASYVTFVYRTSRWQVIGVEPMIERRAAGVPFMSAFWHGRMMLQPFAWDPRYPFHMLISEHRDGLLAADVMRHFGIDVIAGSTSGGGAHASRALLRFLKGGGWIGVTPDGPRGPRMRASLGIIRIAGRARVPIQPVTFSTSRRRILGSWDRFWLAFPFSRGVFIYDALIEVPADADESTLEAKRKQLEDSLNRIGAEADRMVGHSPLEPEPDSKAATP
jgi:lysophospholipid acyltransferase (LPLAT)-like uncharacterized protein